MMWFLLACATPPAAPTTTTEPAEQAKAPSKKGLRSNTDLAGLETALEDGHLVLDVRTQAEWKKGRVPGVKHLPLAELKTTHPLLKDHDRAKPVFLLCMSGGRSSIAADSLAEVGFQTFNVEGGTGAWMLAGKPIQTD